MIKGRRFAAVLAFGLLLALGPTRQTLAASKSKDCYKLLAGEPVPQGFPLIAIEPDFLTPNEISWIRSLYRKHDKRLLRKTFDQEGGILIRSLPCFTVKFRVVSGHIRDFEFTYTKDNDPRGLKIFRQIFQRIIDRALADSEEMNTFLNGQVREGQASLIRYVLEPNASFPELGWHHDGYEVQAIIPVSIPRNLEGAELGLRKRPASSEDESEVQIVPAENQATIFYGKKTYHNVSAYRFVDSKRRYRDILTLGFVSKIKDKKGAYIEKEQTASKD